MHPTGAAGVSSVQTPLRWGCQMRSLWKTLRLRCEMNARTSSRTQWRELVFGGDTSSGW